jgi:excisionase family DNA binding protein
MDADKQRDEGKRLLTPTEVATLFRVDPKTVTRWAKAGKLKSIRSLGGHRRYRETEVRIARKAWQRSCSRSRPVAGPGDPELDL